LPVALSYHQALFYCDNCRIPTEPPPLPLLDQPDDVHSLKLRRAHFSSNIYRYILPFRQHCNDLASLELEYLVVVSELVAVRVFGVLMTNVGVSVAIVLPSAGERSTGAPGASLAVLIVKDALERLKGHFNNLTNQPFLSK